MHNYLRTIGFSEIRTDEDADALLDGIQASFTDNALTVTEDDGQVLFQICAAVGERLGICIEGYKKHDGTLVRQEYFPFLISTDMSTTVPVSIHERVDGRGLSGLADDIRLGITLIFRLTNSVAYRKYRKTGKPIDRSVAYLSAFSRDGKVILPVRKDPADQGPVDAGLRHDMLIEAAKNGNQRAIEILNNEDMNTYAMVTDRLTREDIYSVVDSCFMPQGVECDIYQIVGDIAAVEKLENLLTDEFVYDLTVSCNDMVFHVGIAESDIEGDPKPGRRFKGRIWMQGRVEFPG
jgi:hypothetical protein